MKKIKLSQGKFAIVDDEDFDRINSSNWCAAKNRNTFYAQRAIFLDSNDGIKKRKTIKMHREILGVQKSEEIVDHINHDGLDNRKENLRIVDHIDNQRNRRNRKVLSNSSVRGVYKQGGKFRAYFCYKNNKFFLGKYDTLDEAQKVYLNAEKNTKKVIDEIIDSLFR